MTPSSTVIGHEATESFLLAALRAGRLANAYLLVGPERVGKFTLALRFARSINCRIGTPCDGCRRCDLILRGLHPEVQVLSVPPDRRLLPIGDIRELQHVVALKTTDAPHRVVIFPQANRLSDDAANCLLKILEEPPSGVVLILCAPDYLSLLPTVVSRCQLLRLRPVPTARVAQHLVEEKGLPWDAANRIARGSHGLPGWAIEAAENPDLLLTREARLKDLVRLVSAKTSGRLTTSWTMAENWAKNPEAVRDLLVEWLQAWRVLLNVILVATELPPTYETVMPMLSHLAPPTVMIGLAATVAALRDLESNVHPRLALDAYMLTLPTTGGAGVPARHLGRGQARRPAPP